MTELIAFLGISAILIVTPGPDTAVTIRNSLIGGRRAGVFTAVGVSCGQATWTIACAVGLAALLAASEPTFLAVRIVGAAYLVWLGLHALAAAIRGRRREVEAPRSRPLEPRRAFRQGLFSNLGNPKMAAFFPSLLPQFGHSFSTLLGLGFLFSLMTLVWLTAYAVAVARAGDFLSRSWVKRAVEAITGVVLIALGLRLATEQR